MRKNNRQRRAAKQKRRRAQAKRLHRSDHSHRQHPGDDPAGTPPGMVELLLAAVDGHRRRDREVVDYAIELLLSLSDRLVASELQNMLERQVSRIWEAGWQPADVMHLVAKRLTDSEGGLLRCAIAAQAAGYEKLGARAAPDWMAQLNSLEANRWWEPAELWPLQVNGDWEPTLSAGVRLLDLLLALPSVPVLDPPPSQWDSLSRPAANQGDRLPVGILAKVRALLAKAESTSFDAEAESLTAKAQEMMTRHRIDRATLGAGSDAAEEEPVGRRVHIDDPYAREKAGMLAGIAAANGCSAVWSKGLGFSTNFGFRPDLEATEELFTSLLVQATSALQREGSKWDRFGRSRTTRFRRSFLIAFGDRISQRLIDTANETVEAMEAERGTALVPVLASRSRAAGAAAEKAFPGLGAFTVSASDREGWMAGAKLGDEVDLTGEDHSYPRERPAAVGR